MSDKVSVNLEENSRYRVARDIARHIATTEKVTHDREYYLRLVRQCVKALDTYYSIDEVVTGKKQTTGAFMSF